MNGKETNWKQGQYRERDKEKEGESKLNVREKTNARVETRSREQREENRRISRDSEGTTRVWKRGNEKERERVRSKEIVSDNMLFILEFT